MVAFGKGKNIVFRIGIDLELGADGIAAGVIALAVNAVTGSGLAKGNPGDDETAIGQVGDARV